MLVCGTVHTNHGGLFFKLSCFRRFEHDACIVVVAIRILSLERSGRIVKGCVRRGAYYHGFVFREQWLAIVHEGMGSVTKEYEFIVRDADF